jgi:hypothetical protein
VSDFLTNLAARTSASAEVLKPRLPSIFEPKLSPVPPVLRRTPTIQEGDGEVSEERFSENIQVKPNTFAETQSHGLANRLKPEQADKSLEPTAKFTDERNQLPPVRPAAAFSLPGSSAAAISVKPALAQAIQANVLMSRPPANRQTEAEAKPSVSERRKAEGEVPAPPKVVRPQLESEPLAPNATGLSQPSSEYIARLVRSLIPPRGDARSDAKRSGAAAKGAVVSEPAIHVTIGRIEVRATPEPSAKQERNRPSVMSLDEYLKQRRAGT